jgi:hypothetical protein
MTGIAQVIHSIADPGPAGVSSFRPGIPGFVIGRLRRGRVHLPRCRHNRFRHQRSDPARTPVVDVRWGDKPDRRHCGDGIAVEVDHRPAIVVGIWFVVIGAFEIVSSSGIYGASKKLRKAVSAASEG